MEGEYETAPKLSNGASLNDLLWPLILLSSSRYYSAYNNFNKLAVAQDRAIVTITDQ